MNSIFVLLNIESWKPIVTAFLLPPVPLLFMVLVGARLLLPRRGLGWLIILTSVILLWLSACAGSAQFLTRFVLRPPNAISFDRIQALKATAPNAKPSMAIVVLGGGSEPFAPEYGMSNLQALSMERLRYGAWLSRETGLALGFSGGVGWAQRDGTPEAEVASRIAANELGRPLKWTEELSRDTRENAAQVGALMQRSGVRHILLVTHGWHMPRALRAFQEAAPNLEVEAAPMGLARNVDQASLTWIPTSVGASQTNHVLRELLGHLMGA